MSRSFRPIVISTFCILIFLAIFTSIKMVEAQNRLNTVESKISVYENFICQGFSNTVALQEEIHAYPYIVNRLRNCEYLLFVPESACEKCLESLLQLFHESEIVPDNVKILCHNNHSSKLYDIASEYGFRNITHDGYEFFPQTTNAILAFSYDKVMNALCRLPYESNQSEYIVRLFLSTTKSK